MTNLANTKFPTFLLTTLCVLLALNLAVSVASTSHAAAANAQQNYGGAPTNNAQNAQPGLNGAVVATARTVEQLMEVNQRLARIEARLDKGFNVKVTEMPPVTVNNTVTKVDTEQPKP